MGGRSGTRRKLLQATLGVAVCVAALPSVAVAASPTITSVEPAQGPTSGGTKVTVQGDFLEGIKSVHFGATEAKFKEECGGICEISPYTEFTAVSPAHLPETVDITVTTVQGTSQINAHDKFTYGDGRPTVTNVQPNAGPEVGGTRVAITGVHLQGVAAVFFGEQEASSFTVNSETSISAIAPAGTGTVEVTVEGQEEPSPGDLFHYRPVSAGVAWGLGGSGALGDGGTTDSDVPVAITNLGSEVISLAAGGEHSLALLADGRVMAWGANEWGQLGDGTISSLSDEPVEVKGISDAVAVAAGEYDSLALLKNGQVVAWGQNNVGQLGVGQTGEYFDEPTVVPLGEAASAIAAGSWHGAALLGSGRVVAWGLNEGEAGYGTYMGADSCAGILYCSRAPVPVPGLSGVSAIAAGGDHSLALLRNGHVMAWGYNGSGQLGNGTTEEFADPVRVDDIAGVTAIATGGAQSEALLSNGTVDDWGYNEQEELGDGSSEGSDLAVPVKGLTEVSAIAGGWDEGLAVLDSGHLEAWGWNQWGELGDGTLLNSGVPVEVSGLSEVTAIAASQFALAAGALSPPSADASPPGDPSAAQSATAPDPAGASATSAQSSGQTTSGALTPTVLGGRSGARTKKHGRPVGDRRLRTRRALRNRR